MKSLYSIHLGNAIYKTTIIFVFCYGVTMSYCFGQQEWKLIWADDFNGTTIDMTKWSFQIGNGPKNLPGWGNHELEYYRDKNAFVKDGKLIISIEKEKYNGFNYTSARLRTFGKGDWKFGKIEARIKLPKGKGIWPAFWMMPSDSVYGEWPQSGEIDIMEFKGNDPKTSYCTIHYGPKWPYNKRNEKLYFLDNGDFFSDFHLFSIEWEKDKITWFVDNNQVFTITRDELAPDNWPFNERFYIILNCAVGGDFCKNPDSTTIFPQSMQIDYVRVYQRR